MGGGEFVHIAQYTKEKHTALAAVRFCSRNKTVETIASSTLKLIWRYPEYQLRGRPPAILALNFSCHTRRRIYSDLYQLWNKLSNSRCLAGLLLASISECVSLVTMRFSKSVWTCLPLCLISPPGDDLHLSRGVLSVRLWLLCVTSWHLEGVLLCSVQSVSPQCFTSSALLKLFAKRHPEGTHTVTLFIHRHVHSHTHTHTYIMLHVTHNSVTGLTNTARHWMSALFAGYLSVRAHTAGVQAQQSLISSFTAFTSWQRCFIHSRGQSTDIKTPAVTFWGSNVLIKSEELKSQSILMAPHGPSVSCATPLPSQWGVSVVQGWGCEGLQWWLAVVLGRHVL